MANILSEFETMGREAIAAMQLRRLKRQLDHVWANSPFYRRKLGEAGLCPADIATLDDFERVPFTTKSELRDYNDEFFTAENKRIVDIGASAGTTGRHVLLRASNQDWEDLIRLKMRYLVGAGIDDEDVFQIAAAFGQLFSLGTPIDDALKRLGVTVVRTGPGNARGQVEIMRRVGTTVILCTPDFMFLLAEEARKLGLDPRLDFNLRVGIFFGQSLHTQDWRPNGLNRRIQALWGIDTFSMYGTMEMLTAFVECRHHTGHHVYPDRLLLEVIDPETGARLPPGETGELVFTHLIREATPLVRFRQGDVTRIEIEPCACGRTTPRMMAVLGRVDQMIKIKGTSVYPQQVEEALQEVAAVGAYVIEAFTDKRGMDRIRIMLTTEGPQDTVFREVRTAVKAKARIMPDLIEPITQEEVTRIWFSRGTRKPKRFWDKRKKAG